MSERQPIDPALRQWLAEQAAATAALGDFERVSDAERVRLRRGLIARALQNRSQIPGLPNRVQTRDLTLLGRRARFYRPDAAQGRLPLLVYVHGGGWVAGSIESHDPFCRLLSEASNVMLLSLDYRLAPEHRYPAGLEDTLAGLRWAAEHAHEWGADAQRLALGGDSSGANLATAAAHRFCAEHPDALQALLLLYPVTDHPGADHRSYTQNATGYGLEAEVMRWYWQQYAPGITSDDPNISPLRLARLPALPPTLIATAEYDVLRDEGAAYADKLQAAGVPVTRLHSKDMHHNFAVHPATVARFPQCETTLAQMAAWLRTTLAAAG